METEYDKVLVMKKAGEVVGVIIQDLTTHVPTFYKIERYGMDELKDLLIVK